MNRRMISLALVVIAGEAIFMPPFVVPRLYRPLMLEAWGLSNSDFGTAFAAYGITALISYLIGGPLADKYHPRLLISSSLVLTALGAIGLVLLPSALMLTIMYAFFGVSTILLLWGALIKTTHVAGGDERRSLAMGFLDSGRGLTAAVFASLLVLIISLLGPHLSSSPLAVLQIIYFVTAFILLLVAVGIWFSLKDFKEAEPLPDWELSKTLRCLKDVNVWLLSIVILGSYCGYKAIDNYSIYLVDIQKVSASESSRLMSIMFWLRPIAALFAGYIADKVHHRNGLGRFQVLIVLLCLSGFTQLFLAFGDHSVFSFMFAVIVSSAAFVYALRAIYFSVFGDLKIPTHLVGSAVGITSFVGFMPDIFYGFVTGRLIDANPGLPGFQSAFLFTAVCLCLGAIASYLMFRRMKSVVGVQG